MAATGDAHEGVHNITSNSDWKNALSQKGVFVVDAMATWCGPCKVIAPVLVELSKKYTDVTFYKVDVDEVPDVAQELGVRAMPTLFIFKDGEKIDTVLGANPPAIEAMIQKGVAA